MTDTKKKKTDPSVPTDLVPKGTDPGPNPGSFLVHCLRQPTDLRRPHPPETVVTVEIFGFFSSRILPNSFGVCLKMANDVPNDHLRNRKWSTHHGIPWATL